uniref:NADH dehydrogenase subunit 6 n=1 Tax=Proasellus racovitzai TaxID=1282023 RepID=A0A485M7G0_9CRUS|nr:NADH dehydrogenase subunit 6 [Proasellus racovitzai]
MLMLLASLGGLFLASNTPHMLISSLLASTLLVVILLGLLESFPWLAYILFLIFLGGVLILFTYVSSLSSNLLFSEIKLEVVMLFALLAGGTLMSSKAPHMTNNLSLVKFNTDMFVKELFSPIFYPLYLYLFTYLLITLLYVVVIMKTYYAPLRSAAL